MFQAISNKVKLGVAAVLTAAVVGAATLLSLPGGAGAWTPSLITSAQPTDGAIKTTFEFRYSNAGPTVEPGTSGERHKDLTLRYRWIDNTTPPTGQSLNTWYTLTTGDPSCTTSPLTIGGVSGSNPGQPGHPLNGLSEICTFEGSITGLDNGKVYRFDLGATYRTDGRDVYVYPRNNEYTYQNGSHRSYVVTPDTLVVPAPVLSLTSRDSSHYTTFSMRMADPPKTYLKNDATSYAWSDGGPFRPLAKTGREWTYNATGAACLTYTYTVRATNRKGSGESAVTVKYNCP